MGRRHKREQREKSREKDKEKALKLGDMADMQLYYAMLESQKQFDNEELPIEDLNISEEPSKFQQFAQALRSQRQEILPSEINVVEAVPENEETDEEDDEEDEELSTNEEEYLPSPVFEVAQEFTLDETVQRLLKTVDSLNERIETITLCDLCMEVAKNTAMIPCGHVTCQHCVGSEKCPFCDETVMGRLTIYL
ncbi:E3 ubiquitin-protein ligase bre1 [Acrasis kona]|uniref:E3 ubiquitin-protein ligase bre1 n=1 Tax=Acrasis kona TaxID=1008807 RepID=A0AAW2ZQ54_9EUKA